MRTIFEASTAHVSCKTAEWLDEIGLVSAMCTGEFGCEWPLITVGRFPEGWFMYATSSPPDAMPDDLKAVMAEAIRCGCAFICLDRDADTYAALPTFDW